MRLYYFFAPFRPPFTLSGKFENFRGQNFFLSNFEKKWHRQCDLGPQNFALGNFFFLKSDHGKPRNFSGSKLPTEISENYGSVSAQIKGNATDQDLDFILSEKALKKIFPHLSTVFPRLVRSLAHIHLPPPAINMKHLTPFGKGVFPTNHFC